MSQLPYLLNTNTISYFLKGRDNRLHQQVAQALREKQAAISVLSYAEIRYCQALMAGDDRRHPRINLLLKHIPALPQTVTPRNNSAESKPAANKAAESSAISTH